MMTLHEVLEAVRSYVGERKLAQLRRKLEAATRNDLTAVPIDDPMTIRRQLVAYLRSEGSTPGIVQSYEQLLMGVIRRAALLGLVETPPEGPWSLKWQYALDAVGSRRRLRSCLRGLAAWATVRGIEPSMISEEQIKEWMRVFLPNRKGEVLDQIRSALDSLEDCDVMSVRFRQERLILKASVGSVRKPSDVYKCHSKTALQPGLKASGGEP